VLIVNRRLRYRPQRDTPKHNDASWTTQLKTTKPCTLRTSNDPNQAIRKCSESIQTNTGSL